MTKLGEMLVHDEIKKSTIFRYMWYDIKKGIVLFCEILVILQCVVSSRSHDVHYKVSHYFYERSLGGF